MNQQPDKLFREKLAGYAKPAPAGAWEKIEERLGKKNSVSFYKRNIVLKVAASIALIAVAAYGLWPETAEVTSAIANNDENILKPNEQTANENDPVKDSTEVPLVRSPEASEPQKQKSETKIQPRKKEIKRSADEQQPLLAKQETAQPETNRKEIIESATYAENKPDEALIAHAPAMQREENITLVFSAKEVDEYLDKKSLAQATSDDKKSSTFKKLLKKAADLKTNQDPFGELRQKKNEILALNFKTNERGQNK